MFNNKIISLISLMSIILVSSSCNTDGDHQRDQSKLTTATIRNVDTAHKATDFHQNESVSFDLDLTFGGKKAFQGKVYTMTNSSAILLDYESGKKLLLSDGEIYTYSDPIPTKKNSDRFALLTWQYFFMTPFKLADEGTQWKEIPSITIDNKKYESQMLTFAQGTGESSNDWYIVHPDPNTSLIAHMGYIVTAGGTDIKTAEANAHAISYQDYKTVQGIPFAHRWMISDYTKGVGVGKPIGDAKISNIKLEKAGDTFNPKSDFLFLKYD